MYTCLLYSLVTFIYVYRLRWFTGSFGFIPICNATDGDDILPVSYIQKILFSGEINERCDDLWICKPTSQSVHHEPHDIEEGKVTKQRDEKVI